MERIRTRTAEMWKDGNGIFWVKILPQVEIDAEDIADNLLVTRTLTGGVPHLKVLDTRAKWRMSAAAQAVFRKEDTPEKTIARAVITSSLADQLLQTILTALFKPTVPLRFFTNEEDATGWLLSFTKTKKHAGSAYQPK
jgi:hypothetical protein